MSHQEHIKDPDGKIICRTCLVEFPRTKLFFYVNNRDRYGLLRICKICDNKRRCKKEKERFYHNHKRMCKQCNEFFYASLSAINRGKNYCKDGWGLYCSLKCSRSAGRFGYS